LPSFRGRRAPILFFPFPQNLLCGRSPRRRPHICFTISVVSPVIPATFLGWFISYRFFRSAIPSSFLVSLYLFGCLLTLPLPSSDPAATLQCQPPPISRAGATLYTALPLDPRNVLLNGAVFALVFFLLGMHLLMGESFRPSRTTSFWCSVLLTMPTAARLLLPPP